MVMFPPLQLTAVAAKPLGTEGAILSTQVGVALLTGDLLADSLRALSTAETV